MKLVQDSAYFVTVETTQRGVNTKAAVDHWWATPQRNSGAFDAPEGHLEMKVTYSDPYDVNWRFNVTPSLCAGGGNAVASVDFYNKGSVMKSYHYYKTGVPSCYGFHSHWASKSFSTKGDYTLAGTVEFDVGKIHRKVTFSKPFYIALV
ncbi:hypothetical protein [Kineococcus sp. NPDC059986]|uniref:hypothetical protein n=1 Tax=Kineococcus sp. NPDC059986 TaxID=3155538 RepID=UPI00344B9D9B